MSEDGLQFSDVEEELSQLIQAAQNVLTAWERQSSAAFAGARRSLRHRLSRLPDEVAQAMSWTRWLAFDANLLDDPDGFRACEPALFAEWLRIEEQLKSGVWPETSWLVKGEPRETFPGFRPGVLWVWSIEREDEKRTIAVHITNEVLTAAKSELPPNVALAKETNGRSFAALLSVQDDPPKEVMVMTTGLLDRMPS